MATFRKIHTEFWTDPRVLEEMTPEDRYFYLYLLTNSHTTQIGIYPISKKVMGFELGYSTESINSLMDRFENHHKLIKYNTETRELALINWGEYNLNRGGKPMEDCIKKELSEVKDISLIELVSEKVPCEPLKALFLEYQQQEKETLEPSETVETPEKVEPLDDTLDDTLTSRGQDKEEEKEEDKDKDKDKDKEVKPECRNKLQPVFDAWNKLNLQKLVQIKPSSNRYTLLNARIKEYGLDTVLEAIEQVHKSDFLRGQNERGWCITFDWFIKPNNFIKVLEGNYKRDANGSKNKLNNKVPDNKPIDPLEARLQARLHEKIGAENTPTSEAISQRMAELGIGGRS